MYATKCVSQLGDQADIRMAECYIPPCSFNPKARAYTVKRIKISIGDVRVKAACPNARALW